MRRTRPLAVLCGALLLAGFAVGCGQAPPPEFTPSAKTRQLMPEVRNGLEVKNDEEQTVHVPGIDESLVQRFGTLAEPAVWPLLPVEFGGRPATVAKVVSPAPAAEADADAKPPTEVVVELAPAGDAKAVGDVPAGSQVAWTGGVYEDAAHRVVSFDPKTNRVTLAGEFEDGPPEEGDELLVAAGSMLDRGRELYARHCMHCHGPGGAGDGPTAKYLNPKPRDYRLGVFKFTSTGAPEKASREDVIDVMRRGIPGTSMPAFRLLPEEDLRVLAEYVRWLSMRGEYEFQLASVASSDYSEKALAERIAGGETRDEIVEELKDFMPGDFADALEFTGEDLAEAWSGANEAEAVVVPAEGRVADTAESRARGRELYLSEKTKCATCHGVYGRGDGPQSDAFQLIPGTSDTYPHPGLYDAWDNPIKPRDLTQGVFRGGRRPVDVYRRIRAGIKGTPMPAFGTLTEPEVWDLVNYVLHVPFETTPEPGKGKTLVTAGH